MKLGGNRPPGDNPREIGIGLRRASMCILRSFVYVWAWVYVYMYIMYVRRYVCVCMCACRYVYFVYACMSSQTSLIRASLVYMPHNPKTVSDNLYHFLFTVIQ